MPRILTGAGILVALLAPALAFAAYDTVSLGTNTAISINGIEVDISGSAAVIESITINNDGTFSFTLQSGSLFQITAPNNNRLAADSSTDITSAPCTASNSGLTFSGTTARTVTVSPSTKLCSDTSGGGQSSGGGGGGGGTTTTSATPAVPATPATPTVTSAVPATPATPASGLTTAQVTSILSLLASFDADSATIAKVQAALMGGTGASTSATGSFTRDLQMGTVSSEVKALQAFLNAHGYKVTSSGAGSPGNETTRFGAATRAALIKYQKAKGISPAAGFLGAKTRAAINAE